jgi:hypothetical protein
VVESQPSKLLVAGSIPVSRSRLRSHFVRVSSGQAASCGQAAFSGQAASSSLSRVHRNSLSLQQSQWGEPASLKLALNASERKRADVAQLAERVLGKDEVTSSILVIGSIRRSRSRAKEAPHSWLETRSERGRADGDSDASYGWRASRWRPTKANREITPVMQEGKFRSTT